VDSICPSTRSLTCHAYLHSGSPTQLCAGLNLRQMGKLSGLKISAIGLSKVGDGDEVDGALLGVEAVARTWHVGLWGLGLDRPIGESAGCEYLLDVVLGLLEWHTVVGCEVGIQGVLEVTDGFTWDDRFVVGERETELFA